jgi:hypothetical protein
VSSIRTNAGRETVGSMSGANWSRHTCSSCRKPSMPNANSNNGTSDESIWNEIALANVSRSFATKPSTTARALPGIVR